MLNLNKHLCMVDVPFFARAFLKRQERITRAVFVRTLTNPALLRSGLRAMLFFFRYSLYARQKCLNLILALYADGLC